MDEDDADKPPTSTDLEKLAKDYVDLWEAQIKALAGDEALAKTVAQTVGLMNASAANVAAAMQEMAAQGQAWNGSDVSSGAAGAAADRPASGHSEPDVHELHRRVAELEHRLAALERTVKGEG